MTATALEVADAHYCHVHPVQEGNFPDWPDNFNLVRSGTATRIDTNKDALTLGGVKQFVHNYVATGGSAISVVEACVEITERQKFA